MAIITEEPDSPKTQTAPKKPISKPKPNTNKTTTNPTTTSTTTNPFHFWFYFTTSISLITLVFIIFTSLYPQDPKTWFLTLPPNLRHHYSKGRNIKVQTAPNSPQIEVFTIQEGPTKSNGQSNALIVHGLGCSSFGFRKVVDFLGLRGVHTVAIDLPGSGFSDKSIVVEEENVGGGGVFGRVMEMYHEIQEKGIFWGFDQLVEKGYVDYEEKKSKRNVVKAIDLGPEEMGRVLGQVVDTIGLSPVDLVLHDSAFVLSANWISENRGWVRSVVVLDSAPVGPALPVWVLEVPVLREVVLGFGFVFRRLLGTCCTRLVGDSEEAEGHRVLLKGRDGGRGVVGMGKRLNYSFDLNEWAALDGVKGLPIRVVWSDALSKEWSEEAHRVVDAIPQAKLVTHSGGRWPQEHNSEEVAETIYQFLSSLPKSVKQQMEEEPVPEHIQKMFDEAQSGDDHHHHGHDGHGHSHSHSHGHEHAHAGYMDAYGLGQGWAM